MSFFCISSFDEDVDDNEDDEALDEPIENNEVGDCIPCTVCLHE